MAYMCFDTATTDVPGMGPCPIGPASDCSFAGLTALEWTVVALARGDRLSTLRGPGRIAATIGILFGATHDPRLADPRLEALRRVSVLTWHHGSVRSGAELEAFMNAGFTLVHYRLIVRSAARRNARSAGGLE
jgi:hypothetical protein